MRPVAIGPAGVSVRVPRAFGVTLPTVTQAVPLESLTVSGGSVAFTCAGGWSGVLPRVQGAGLVGFSVGGLPVGEPSPLPQLQCLVLSLVPDPPTVPLDLHVP
jgi:hypothetical protein